METLPIEYHKLYIRNLSTSGGDMSSCEGKGFRHCITYSVYGQLRELWRSSENYIPIGDLILKHENYLLLYKILDPDNEDFHPEFLVQYDSVYNIVSTNETQMEIKL